MSNTEAPAKERDLAFFGAITASVSHDLSNCVCVLDQVSGLLKDLMTLSEQGTSISPDRLAAIRDRLLRQSHKAKELTEGLNRFAHIVDCRWTEFEVNSVIRNLITVSQRFAEMRGLELRIQYWEEDIHFMGDPFLLQQLVFEGLKKASELAASGELIEVSVEVNAMGNCVLISAPGLSNAAEEKLLSPLKQIANSVPARVGISRKGERKRILVRLLNR